MTMLTTPLVVDSFEKQINVLTGINLCVDDVKLVPKDVNRQPVEVFIDNGTINLPVRALSGDVDQNVAWDGKISTVFIGDHESVDIEGVVQLKIEY